MSVHFWLWFFDLGFFVIIFQSEIFAVSQWYCQSFILENSGLAFQFSSIWEALCLNVTCLPVSKFSHFVRSIKIVQTQTRPYFLLKGLNSF